MAIFGDVGKFLGLGSAQQTLQSAARGAIQGAVLGQPLMGAGMGVLGSGTQQGQSTAVDQPGRQAQESQASGTGGFIQNMAQRVPFQQNYVRQMEPFRDVRRPMDEVMPRDRNPLMQPTFAGFGPLIAGAAGMAAPFIIDAITGKEKKLVVTRALKSKVKRAVDLIGVEATADGMGVSEEVVMYILLKKLRNDGAYVTKAAIRKTSSTIRKMKRMCDMYDGMRPTARRRAPARSSSKVMQIKN